MPAEVVRAGEIHESEERALQELVAVFPDSWRVFVNKWIPELPNYRGSEADFIVLSRKRVYVIEHKSWGGQVQLNGRLAHFVGKQKGDEKNPFAQVRKGMDLLQGHLAKHGLGDRVIGIVITTFRTQFDGLREQDRVVHLPGNGYAARRILENDERASWAEIPDGTWERAWSFLAGLEKVPWRIGRYEVTEGRVDGRTRRGRYGNNSYSLRRVDSENRTACDVYDKLCDIANLGLAVTTMEGPVFDERTDESVYAMLDPPKAQPARMNEEKAAELFEAIAHVHRNNLVHGNISPQTFDFSGREAKLVASTFANACGGAWAGGWGAPFPTPGADQFTAPELTRNRGFPTKEGDVYSTAATIRSLFHEPPSKVKEILDRCQDPTPAKRLTSEEAAFQLRIPEGVELVSGAPPSSNEEVLAFYQGVASPSLGIFASPACYQRIALVEELRKLAKNEDGETRVLFLNGDSGSGKSALLDAVAIHVAKDPGVRVLRIAMADAETLWKIKKLTSNRRIVAIVDGMSGLVSSLNLTNLENSGPLTILVGAGVNLHQAPVFDVPACADDEQLHLWDKVRRLAEVGPNRPTFPRAVTIEKVANAYAGAKAIEHVANAWPAERAQLGPLSLICAATIWDLELPGVYLPGSFDGAGLDSLVKKGSWEGLWVARSKAIARAVLEKMDKSREEAMDMLQKLDPALGGTSFVLARAMASRKPGGL